MKGIKRLTRQKQEVRGRSRTIENFIGQRVLTGGLAIGSEKLERF